MPHRIQIMSSVVVDVAECRRAIDRIYETIIRLMDAELVKSKRAELKKLRDTKFTMCSTLGLSKTTRELQKKPVLVCLKANGDIPLSKAPRHGHVIRISVALPALAGGIRTQWQGGRNDVREKGPVSWTVCYGCCDRNLCESCDNCCLSH